LLHLTKLRCIAVAVHMHVAGGGVLTGSCWNKLSSFGPVTLFQQLPHSLLQAESCCAKAIA
jgi:hypothetical protein